MDIKIDRGSTYDRLKACIFPGELFIDDEEGHLYVGDGHSTGGHKIINGYHVIGKIDRGELREEIKDFIIRLIVDDYEELIQGDNND